MERSEEGGKEGKKDVERGQGRRIRWLLLPPYIRFSVGTPFLAGVATRLSPLLTTISDPHTDLTSDNDRDVCVRSKTRHFISQSFSSARFTENPFSSTHSLDANPFDDPASDPAHASRMEELAQRERDLERREAELAQKADHIKKHGRNNFPPCESSRQNLHMTMSNAPDSLPAHLSFNCRRDSGSISSWDHPSLSAVAGSWRHTPLQHGCLHRELCRWCQRQRQ